MSRRVKYRIGNLQGVVVGRESVSLNKRARFLPDVQRSRRGVHPENNLRQNNHPSLLRSHSLFRKILLIPAGPSTRLYSRWSPISLFLSEMLSPRGYGALYRADRSTIFAVLIRWQCRHVTSRTLLKGLISSKLITLSFQWVSPRILMPASPSIATSTAFFSLRAQVRGGS